MISLIKRQEIKKTKKLIGSDLGQIQRASYDSWIFETYENETERKEYHDLFDFMDYKSISMDTFNSIIGIDHHEINTFTKQLSVKLVDLLKAINLEEFYIISDLKCDFFGNRDNKFQPLVNAYKQLEGIVNTNTYKESFKIGLMDLPEFIDTLFWITRCDPTTAEYFFIFDVNETMRMEICKYGNVHLTQFNNKFLSDKLLNSLGWTTINGQEVDVFSIP